MHAREQLTGYAWATRPAAVLVALLSVPAAALAQTPPDSREAGDTVQYILEPVNVTAERERSAPPPVATLRIDPEVVQRAQSDNPYELMRRVAGLEVHEQGQGPGFASNTVIRGFTSDHSSDVLLVVDGVPINLPIHGHVEGFADWNLVIPPTVSSLRVIHGPASPLYGDFALGGVTEVFTAAEREGAEGGLSTSSHGDVGGWLRLGRSGEQGGSALAVQAKRVEGWRRNDDYLLGNAILRGWRRAGEGRLEGGLYLYASDWDSPGFLSVGDYNAGRLRQAMDPSDGGRTERVIAQGRYALTLNPNTFLQAMGWAQAGSLDIYLNVPGHLHRGQLSQTGERDRRHGAGGQVEISWVPAIGEFTLGISGRTDASSYDHGATLERDWQATDVALDARHQSGAVYGRWRYSFRERLGLDLGGRVDVLRFASLDRLSSVPDWREHVTTIASPKLGLRYRLTDELSLRASSSRGFRTAVGTVGEPGTPPIVAWAQEVGFDYEGPGWDLSIGAFRLDVANERILDPVTRAISSSGSSVRQGLDFFGRLELGRGLALQGGATWNDARLSGGYADPHEDHGHGHEHEHGHEHTHAAGAAAAEGGGELRPTRSAFHQGPAHDHDAGGDRVPGVARYTGNVAAEADLIRGIWLRGGWRFTGPYAPIGEPDIRTRAYAVADVSVHLPLTRATELNVELQNVFGRRYPEIRASGFISPGAPRTLRLGMNFSPPRGQRKPWSRKSQ